MSDMTWSEALGTWSVEPTLAVGFALLAALYARGWRTLQRRASVSAAVPLRRALAFAVGLLLAAIALLSPLTAFSGLLFSLHLVQNLLLTMAAAPLLLIGRPWGPLLWGLPAGAHRALATLGAPGTPLHAQLARLTRPLWAFWLHTLVLWGSYMPPIYNAAMRSDLLHALQHALLFGTALLFWWPVIQPSGRRRALSYGSALLYLASAVVAQTKLVGAMLIFAGAPLYARYSEAPRLVGASALADQQLAGMLMTVGGFLLLFLAAGIVFFRWAADEDHPQARLHTAPQTPVGPHAYSDLDGTAR